VIDSQAAAQQYQAHASLSNDPDYCGRLLYEAAVQACRDACQAHATQNWAQWNLHVGKAQQIAAVFYDVARMDSEAALVFKRYHQLVWGYLNTALLERDEAALRDAQGYLEECLRQIQARIAERSDVSDMASTF